MITVHNSHNHSVNDLPGIVLCAGEMVVNETNKNLFPHRPDILVVILRITKGQSFGSWKWLLGIFGTSVIYQNDCVNIRSKATFQSVTSYP